MGSSQPWIDAANNIIEQSRTDQQPVWLDLAVKDIIREHPDCGLTEPELANIVRQLVIEQRWSVA
jgi:hypothetical protein